MKSSHSVVTVYFFSDLSFVNTNFGKRTVLLKEERLYKLVSTMIRTGEISTSQNGEEVEWRIFDFFGLSENHRLGYSSPDFHVGGDRWNLVIFQNGQSEHDTYGHVDLELCKKSAASYVIQKFSLSLKTVKGEKENEKECSEMFYSWDYHSILRFISRSELSRRRFELVPDGVLTVICTMKNWAYAESSSKSFYAG